MYLHISYKFIFSVIFWKSRTRVSIKRTAFFVVLFLFHFLSGLQKHVSQNLYLAHTTFLFYISKSFLFFSFSYKDPELKKHFRLSEKTQKPQQSGHRAWKYRESHISFSWIVARSMHQFHSYLTDQNKLAPSNTETEKVCNLTMHITNWNRLDFNRFY